MSRSGLVRAARYRKRHRTTIRKRDREHYRRHRTTINEQRRARYQVLRAQVLAAYGGRCMCCGEDRQYFLQIDHVRGGGGKERRRGLYGDRLYRHLRRLGFPAGYRTLCANCNWARRAKAKCPCGGRRRR